MEKGRGADRLELPGGVHSRGVEFCRIYRRMRLFPGGCQQSRGFEGRTPTAADSQGILMHHRINENRAPAQATAAPP